MSISPSPHGRNLRKGRHSEHNRIYFITTVTHNREGFFNDLNCGRFVAQVLQREQPWAKTLAFVIMPDHLHWLIQLSEGATLDKVMGRVKSVSAHRINGHLLRSGPAWQEGYHDHALRKEEELEATARYIIHNPVRAGLVASLGDYPLWDCIWLGTDESRPGAAPTETPSSRPCRSAAPGAIATAWDCASESRRGAAPTKD